MQSRWELAKELQSEVKREERMTRIAELEDRVCDCAAGVIEAVLSFHEVTPQQTEPPASWVAEYGEEAARQRLEVAKSGWLPNSLAPNATKLASYIYTGITRARGHKAALGTRTLNVKIALPAPTSSAHPVVAAPTRPEIEIE